VLAEVEQLDRPAAHQHHQERGPQTGFDLVAVGHRGDQAARLVGLEHQLQQPDRLPLAHRVDAADEDGARLVSARASTRRRWMSGATAMLLTPSSAIGYLRPLRSAAAVGRGTGLVRRGTAEADFRTRPGAGLGADERAAAAAVAVESSSRSCLVRAPARRSESRLPGPRRPARGARRSWPAGRRRRA
jgi:hypothetical protein